jgi:pimeloyl-ACP methyl ester carboxylesterase
MSVPSGESAALEYEAIHRDASERDASQGDPSEREAGQGEASQGEASQGAAGEQRAIQREAVTFRSGADDCAAWHYQGSNGACVVMAGGAGVTKEPATDRFAARFHAGGFSVLAFDYRHFGESGGQPRQLLRVRDQLADWQSAFAFATSLPGVHADRIAGWGFSLAGGHLLRLAADGRRASGQAAEDRRAPRIAAIIAQAPLVSGPASMPNALRHETLPVLARFPVMALHDVARGLLHRDPVLVPLAGQRGTVAMLTTPDATDGDRALNPDNAYPNWQQSIAARSVLSVGVYRPARAAHRIACPVLAVVSTRDQSVLAGPGRKVARRVPRAELLEIEGGHYAAFGDHFDTVVTAELDFLRRHLLAAAGC